MNNNTTVSREILDGFPGMDVSTSRGKKSCRLQNFRVLSDGSLEKREGVRLLASLGATVRGICSFTDGNEEVILAAAGNALYRIGSDGTITSSVAFATTSGKVGFLMFRGELLLFDGDGIYRYDGGCTASHIQGYAPLYGKNWSGCGYLSDVVNEPINFASSHIRIQYLLNEESDYLHVGLHILSVDWVMQSEYYLEADSYSVSNDGYAVNFTSPLATGNVVIGVTLDGSYYHDSTFYTAVNGATFDDFAQSRAFLFGGSDPSRMFVSVPMKESSLAASKAGYPNSCELYFPKSQSLSFGSGQSITAVQRLYDRMMILFPDSVWVTPELKTVETNNLQFSPLCNHMGCSAENAILMTGAASPVTVTSGGIYRWKMDPDFIEECVTERISDAILPMLGDNFFTSAKICHYRRRAELWFRDPTDSEGKIFVYGLDTKKWSMFSGIPADELFSCHGGVGFVDGGCIYLFDTTQAVDNFTDGVQAIEAVYESGFLDFSDPGVRKRLAGMTVSADLNDGILKMQMRDNGEIADGVMSNEGDPGDMDPSGIYELRLTSGRFRHARLSLRAPGAARQRIYRAEIYVQKEKGKQ